jgi:hypothetical protein
VPNLNDIDHFWGSDTAASATADLGTVEGTSRGQQRVLRRLLTNPRAVLPDGTVLPADYPFHPEYGAGLPRYVGLAVDPAQIVALIRGQILLEDSVARIPAPVISVSPFIGGLSVAIRYTDAATSTPATLSFNVNQ